MKINLKRWARFGVLVIACCLALGSIACGPDQIRAGARAFSQGAKEGQREVQSLQKSGDLNAAEAESISHVLDQLEISAQNFGHSLDGYDRLDNAAKRAMIQAALDEIEPILFTLEQEGPLRPQSEKARKRFSKVLAGLRYGSSVLRIVQVAIPPDDPPLAWN